MRIYFSEREAPMLVEALKEMNELHMKLNDFLASAETNISIEADRYGGAEPYSELLRGLHVEKSQGPINLTVTETRWLNLEGSSENLKRYVSQFRFEDGEESSHHHPGNGSQMQRGSMDLIVEVDTDWIQELRGRRH